MPGKIEPEFIQLAILGFSIMAAVTDLIWGKIYNSLVVVMSFMGLGVGFLNGGFSALFQAFLGFALGLLLFGWMFQIGVMGGGDVKFLMALGIWGGPGYSAQVALLSVLIGGLMAAVLLLIRGRIQSFMGRMYYSVLTLFVKGLKFEAPDWDRQWTMPFGVPLALAAVWVIYRSPFRGLFG